MLEDALGASVGLSPVLSAPGLLGGSCMETCLGAFVIRTILDGPELTFLLRAVSCARLRAAPN